VTRSRRVAAETIGTALLLAAIVGSGIMGERLAGGNVAIALLANSIATGAALVALILAFGPISGAHFNPFVTLCVADRGGLHWRDVPLYVAAQIIGAALGVVAAHLMFGESVVSLSTHVRSGLPQAFSEYIATFGLIAIISSCARSRAEAVPFAVGAYITSAYWFTASTSFANPAVTLARAMTGTFAGIRPVDVPVFLAAQLLGALSAALLFGWLVPGKIGRTSMKTVIFACVHNAGRSQMAAAFFNAMANPDLARAVSAGTQPGPHVHPEVVEVMAEVGIDLAHAKPQLLSDELARGADMLITMGCGDACPHVRGLQRDDWPLADPKGQPIDRVREIREEIRARVERLLARESW
jgi:glycerol uptake facilitator-like aquaporin